MSTITTKVTVYWQLKFANHYKFTKNGRCFNARTGNEIKQVLKSRCLGYNIKGKFYSLTRLRDQLELIPKSEYVPF